MKVLLLALAVFTTAASASNWDNKQICDDRIEKHEELRDRVTDHFNVGEVTRVEVANAELALLKARYECGRIGIALYCGASGAQMSHYLNGIIDEARVGQRSDTELVAAYERHFELRNQCK